MSGRISDGVFTLEGIFLAGATNHFFFSQVWIHLQTLTQMPLTLCVWEFSTKNSRSTKSWCSRCWEKNARKCEHPFTGTLISSVWLHWLICEKVWVQDCQKIKKKLLQNSLFGAMNRKYGDGVDPPPQWGHSGRAQKMAYILFTLGLFSPFGALFAERFSK